MTKNPSKARPAMHAQGSVEHAKASVAKVQPDAVSLLRADHKKLRMLLTELKGSEKPAQRRRLLISVKAELEAHTTIEEEIFYPAFCAAAETQKDQRLYHEATAEHHAVKLMLQEVEGADDATEQFSGRAKVLKELVEHHAEEEEEDMFPRARELIGAAELRTLGRQMAERKKALLGGDSATSTLQKMADFVSSSFAASSKQASEARA